VFISVNDHDKNGIIVPAKTFQKLGFTIMSTRGTAAFLAGHGVECVVVNKVYEGRPNVIDHIKNGDIQLVINTSSGKRTKEDSSELRKTTVLYGLPYTTNLAAAKALAMAIKERNAAGLDVKCLQEYYRDPGRDH
jgi:carbamoyl-phosphate synthase large subunit